MFLLSPRRIPLVHPWRRIGILLIGLLAFSAGNAAPEQIDDDFTLNLTDADIAVFIQTVSEITGRNFVIDPRVKGKVTVITATPTSAGNIYEMFLSVLQVNGFIAVPSGNVIKILPDVGASQQASAVDGNADGDQLVTRIIEVQHVSVKQLAVALKPLLPPTAHLSSHPEAKLIVVADTASNVERLAQIIDRIDRASDQQVDIVPLQYSDAEQVIDTLNSLHQESMQRAQSPGADLASMVADTRSNSVLVSGPPAERARLRILIQRLDVPTDNLRGARVIYLKHAVATDLQKVLKAIGEKLLRTQSKSMQQFEVEADGATNALIVTAPADMMAEMEAIIAKLDVARAQVQVEGIIAEISYDRGVELGVEWQTSLPTDGVYGISRGPLAGGSTSSIPPGLNGALGFPNITGSGVSLGYFSGGDLRVLLKALATDSATKILSTPTVVTLDNKRALIHVGKNVPIVTGTFTNESGAQDPFQTIERRDVGIKLEVTPQINEGNTVRLEIRQEVSSVDPSTNDNGLVTNERTIETTVQVENGEIIALGGLISDDVAEQKSSVPYLGNIPLFGELFTTRRSTLERKNLVVFLRPTILTGDGKGMAMVEHRYRSLRELQLDGGGQGREIKHMPGERSATLPPYPPSPNEPMIALPKPENARVPAPEAVRQSSEESSGGGSLTESSLRNEYSLLGFE